MDVSITANSYDFECRSKAGDTVKLQGKGGPEGIWGDWAYCEPGDYICGLKTQVEENQGWGDDTALNGARFNCCYSADKFGK